jgi:hypothetical protein
MPTTRRVETEQSMQQSRWHVANPLPLSSLIIPIQVKSLIRERHAWRVPDDGEKAALGAVPVSF